MCSGYCQPHGNVQHKTATLSVCQLQAYVTCNRRVTKVFPSLASLAVVLLENSSFVKYVLPVLVCLCVCVFCLFSCLRLVCDCWQWSASRQIFICLLGGGIYSNPRACLCGLYPSPPVYVLYRLLRSLFLCVDVWYEKPVIGFRVWHDLPLWGYKTVFLSYSGFFSAHCTY